MKNRYQTRLPAVLLLWTAVVVLTLATAAHLVGAAPQTLSPQTLSPQAFSPQATLTVCPAGPPACDHTTIQAAIDAATAGDTVRVEPGQYDGSLVVDTSLTLESTGGAAVTTIAVTGTPGIAATGVPSLTIRGFTIQPTAPISGSIVALDFSGGHVAVEQSVIRAFEGEDATAVRPEGESVIAIRYAGAGRLSVLNTTIEDFHAGAGLYNSSGDGGEAIGVVASGTGTVVVTNSVIRSLQGGDAAQASGLFGCSINDSRGGPAVGIRTVGGVSLEVGDTEVTDMVGGGPCYLGLGEICPRAVGPAIGVDATNGSVAIRASRFLRFALQEGLSSDPNIAIRTQRTASTRLTDNLIFDHSRPPFTQPVALTPSCSPPASKMTAVWSIDDADIDITDNVIDRVYGRGVAANTIGIHLERVGMARVQHNEVRDVTGGFDAETTGLRVDGGDRVMVAANRFGPLVGEDAPGQAWEFYQGDDGGDAFGMVLADITTITTTNNVVRDLTAGRGSTLNGFPARDGGDARSLHVAQSDGLVANNVFFETTAGLGGNPDGLPGIGQGVWVESSTGVTVINNAIVGHEIGLAVAAGQSVVAKSNSYWANDQHYDGIAPDHYDQIAPPEFVDPAAGDFRLQPHSLLVDAGLNVGAPAVDIFGTSRPLDGNLDGFNNADTGVHEYWYGLRASYMGVTPVSASPGQTLTYRLVLGEAVDVVGFDVTVTDVLPPDLHFVPGSLAASAGTANESGGIITWEAPLLVGDTVTLTFDVTVAAGLVGPLAIGNEATVATSLGPSFPLAAVAFVDAESMRLPFLATP